MVAVGSSRFGLGTPGLIQPEVKPRWEEGKSWFERNLPDMLKTATQIAAIPLDIALPGVGQVVGQVAGQGVKLGTMAAQGREVSSDDYFDLGLGAAKSGATAGMQNAARNMQAQQLERERQMSYDKMLASRGMGLPAAPTPLPGGPLRDPLPTPRAPQAPPPEAPLLEPPGTPLFDVPYLQNPDAQGFNYTPGQQDIYGNEMVFDPVTGRRDFEQERLNSIGRFSLDKNFRNENQPPDPNKFFDPNNPFGSRFRLK